MSYHHIENLYKDPTILLFRECYALEKIHGTSARVAWRENRVWLSSGGAPEAEFKVLFDQPALAIAFFALGHPSVEIFGEAYGGKEQGQAWRYGPDLRFVAFEVRIGEEWLAVPEAERVVRRMGLEFVHYARVSTDAVDAERDAPSVQARRNGVVGDQPREGVVLRPLIELVHPDGSRLIAKHKRDEERETATPRRVGVFAQMLGRHAGAVAYEWVTPRRLEHVLQKLPAATTVAATRDVIAAMIEDVLREGAGEVEDCHDVRRAIGARAAELFQEHLKSVPAPEKP
jgi:hypothetical protein